MRLFLTENGSVFRHIPKGRNSMLYYGISDTGRKRTVNQDSFFAEFVIDGCLLLAVCDGMGGANGGNVASSLALSRFADSLKQTLPVDRTSSDTQKKISDALRRAVLVANEEVYARASEDPELSGMGTTLVAALICGHGLYIVNVGDSRLYAIGRKSISLLTHDHSFVQLLVDMGEMTEKEAAKSPQKNIITKAIGTESAVEPDLFFHNLDDLGATHLLLCSDGLTNFISEEKIRSIASGAQEEKDIVAACEKLIGTANKNGGGDNITAILLKLQ